MLKTVGLPSTRTGDQTIVGGNLVIGTAGKGIDFSADPSAPGMTSELLNDYEEGTFTATLTASISAPTTPVTTTATYTKIGRSVTVNVTFLNATTLGAVGDLLITGLPYTSSITATGSAIVGSAIGNYSAASLAASTTTLALTQINTGNPVSIPSTTGVYIFTTIIYFT